MAEDRKVLQRFSHGRRRTVTVQSVRFKDKPPSPLPKVSIAPGQRLDPPPPQECRAKGREILAKWEEAERLRAKARARKEEQKKEQKKQQAEARAKAKGRALARARDKEEAKAEARRQKWANQGRKGSVSHLPLELGRSGLPEEEENDPPTRPSRSASDRYWALLRRHPGRD
jgi:hypothetical protein